MGKVFISLGTNLGNKQLNLNHAIAQIEKHIGLVAQKSSIYETEPWGYQSFNNFLNQIIVVKTILSPSVLMDTLLQIEKSMGRNRKHEGYQDRIIDLDIILIDQLVIRKDRLTIPHPKLHLRQFILEPLAEIEPEFLHPVFKKTIKALLTELTQKK